MSHSPEGGKSREDGLFLKRGGTSAILALSSSGVGSSPSFEHLLAPFPEDGEIEAWHGNSGKGLRKGAR